MVLALEKQWIWDSWYARVGDTYHCYFLKADKSLIDPELRHLNVSYGHATSDDLINWTHLGTCFQPTTGDGWDNYTTWTGSVIKEGDLWHLFYTGANRAENGLYQRLGHATSTDMHNWERVGDGFILDIEGPNAHHYEADHMVGFWHDRAMRDPFVMKDPDGNGWLMYFTARAAGVAEPNAGGCIGFATSDDLYTWTLQPPVYTGTFGQLEVPQVFQAGGKWFCLFCTAAEHYSKERAETQPGGPVTGNHYLIGDSPRGPWRMAPGFLDGALPPRRYAARIVETDDGMVIMGFADRPDGGEFVGHIMDPEPVEVTSEGLLQVVPQSKAAE